MPNKRLNLTLKGAALAAGALCLVVLVGWKCPLHYLVGLPCPGCGMQTAFLALVHGQWAASLQAHALLLPTMAGLCVLPFVQEKMRWRILIVWAAAMLVYYIIRMFTLFPAEPLDFNAQALLPQLFRASGF